MPENPPAATSGEAATQTCDSALSLARAFGRSIYEPSWWTPLDPAAIDYHLARFSDESQYFIGCVNDANNESVGAIGRAEAPNEKLEDGAWYTPSELRELRGSIGRVGRPSSLEAVLHLDGLTIRLFGFNTEAVLVKVAQSLRRVDPGDVAS